jgi:hypothetical protein
VVDSSFLKRFARLPGILLPVGLAAAGIVGLLFGPDELIVPHIHEPLPDSPGPVYVAGPIWASAFLLLFLSYTVGLVATILAWRRAESLLQRRKSGALAFSARDITFGGFFLAGLVVLSAAGTTPTREELEGTFILSYYGMQVTAWGLIAFVVLLAYGIASANVFDIDLKLKLTIQRGTVAALFVAVFFIVSEGAAAFLSDRFGTVLGLLATGSLLFLIAPLQGWAERVSDAALPDVHDSPEYRTFRKLLIYGEAVRDAAESGTGVDTFQRAALNQLRAKLELTVDDTSDFERELGLS